MNRTNFTFVALDETKEECESALSQWKNEYDDVLQDDYLPPPPPPLSAFSTSLSPSNVGFRRTASENTLGNLRRRRFASHSRKDSMSRVEEQGYFNLSSAGASTSRLNESTFSIDSYNDYDGYEGFEDDFT